MLRKSLIAGNWKMNGLLEDSTLRVSKLSQLLKNLNNNVEVVICPPFTLTSSILQETKNTIIKLGAQDCHYNTKGAHTGDISPAMLKDVGCEYVIIGHSERRVDHKETNELIKNKASSAINNALSVILCVGENKQEKEEGLALKIVENQLKNSLPENADYNNTIIAYEPVWAIGTGLVPTIEEIENMHKEIRNILNKLKNKETASKMRILYGGSLNAKNCKEILALENVDGGLIGGASLVADDFFNIISNAKNYK